MARGEAPGRAGRSSPDISRLSPILAPLAVVALAFPAIIPLLQGGQIPGSDDVEHLIRTAEYGRAVASGIWWPQWAPNLGHGYGEPIFLFNPPLFYILGSLVKLAGGSVVSAVNLACAMLLVVGALGAYAWTALALGRWGGLVAGVAYVWSPYVSLDLYVRQALTELAAVCVFPWALWGLARTCQAPSPRRLALAALAVGLLLLASTPAMVVVALALLGQVLALARWRRPAGAASALAAPVLGGLLAAAFWLPASAERHLLRFDRLLAGPAAYPNHFLDPGQLVSSYWGYGGSVPGPDDTMGFGLGRVNLALAACAVLLLVTGQVRGVMRRQAWLAVGLVAVGCALSLELSAPIWAWRPELQYLQFPWRFLILPTVGLAALAAVPAALVARERPKVAALLALICVGLLMADGWGRARPEGLRQRGDERYAPEAVAAMNRGKATRYEYETVWNKERPAEPPAARLVAMSGSATIVEQAATAHEQRFAVTTRESARLRLNTFYFPGWRVFVDGQEQPIDYGNRSGLIDFSVEPGTHVVEARFEPTPVRWLGRTLSVGGLAVLALLMVWPRRVGHRLTVARAS